MAEWSKDAFAELDEVAALRAEVARLREALKPFAARTNSEAYIRDPETPDDGLCAGMSYTAGDYRRARAALEARK